MTRLQLGPEHLFGVLRAFLDTAALKKNRAVVSLDLFEHPGQIFTLPIAEERHKHEHAALKDGRHRQQR